MEIDAISRFDNHEACYDIAWMKNALRTNLSANPFQDYLLRRAIGRRLWGRSNFRLPEVDGTPQNTSNTRVEGDEHEHQI